MERISSFAPVVNTQTRVLIVGTMPSVKSLETRQFYGNRQNAFWPIVYASFGRQLSDDYGTRTAFLLENGLGLWDAAQSCIRPGSLDSSMRDIVLNDFDSFFSQYPGIRRVLCNGGQAHRLFLKATGGTGGGKEVIRLPSTSPAAAMYSFAQKLESWKPYLVDGGIG